MTRYVSAVDTAKLIRAALKANFPGTKFSVRTDKYSGGASVRVHWTNGPTKRDVEAVTSPFAGGSFDGMVDLAYSWTSYLRPDGSAGVAHSSGTVGSRGSVPAVDNDVPADAELVRFGAKYVFCDREVTADVRAAAAAWRDSYFAYADWESWNAPERDLNWTLAGWSPGVDFKDAYEKGRYR